MLQMNQIDSFEWVMRSPATSHVESYLVANSVAKLVGNHAVQPAALALTYWTD